MAVPLAAASAASASSFVAKKAELRQLRDMGLLDEAEYEGQLQRLVTSFRSAVVAQPPAYVSGAYGEPLVLLGPAEPSVRLPPPRAEAERSSFAPVATRSEAGSPASSVLSVSLWTKPPAAHSQIPVRTALAAALTVRAKKRAGAGAGGALAKAGNVKGNCGIRILPAPSWRPLLAAGVAF